MDVDFSLSSPAFENGGIIPEKYTCDASPTAGGSPPLSISGVPEGTKSFVLIVEDPDIPRVFKESRGIEAFDHWVLYNIPADTTEILEGTNVGIVGMNSAGKVDYASPCPPPEYEPSEHRYIFSLYALSGMLTFAETPTAREVRTALAPMILAEATLVGRYSRK